MKKIRPCTVFFSTGAGDYRIFHIIDTIKSIIYVSYSY